jgi:hypothetical protein
MAANFRPRVSTRTTLLAIAATAIVLAPLASSYRRDAALRARPARAAALARACLEANGWSAAKQSDRVFLAGEKACRVDIRIRSGEGRRRPESVIVPHDEGEPLIVLFREVGPLSGAQSRAIVARGDFRVIEDVEAE